MVFVYKNTHAEILCVLHTFLAVFVKNTTAVYQGVVYYWYYYYYCYYYYCNYYYYYYYYYYSNAWPLRTWSPQAGGPREPR